LAVAAAVRPLSMDNLVAAATGLMNGEKDDDAGQSTVE